MRSNLQRMGVFLPHYSVDMKIKKGAKGTQLVAKYADCAGINYGAMRDALSRIEGCARHYGYYPTTSEDQILGW